MGWTIKGLAWLLSGVILALAAIWAWSAGANPYWPVIFVAFAGFSLQELQGVHGGLAEQAQREGGDPGYGR